MAQVFASVDKPTGVLKNSNKTTLPCWVASIIADVAVINESLPCECCCTMGELCLDWLQVHDGSSVV